MTYSWQELHIPFNLWSSEARDKFIFTNAYERQTCQGGNTLRGVNFARCLFWDAASARERLSRHQLVSFTWMCLGKIFDSNSNLVGDVAWSKYTAEVFVPCFHFGEVIDKQSSSRLLIHISIIFHRLFILEPWEIFILWNYVLNFWLNNFSTKQLLSPATRSSSDWMVFEKHQFLFLLKKIFLVCKWNVIEAPLLLKKYFWESSDS